MNIKVRLSRLKKLLPASVPEYYKKWTHESDPVIDIPEAEALPEDKIKQLHALALEDKAAGLQDARAHVRLLRAVNRYKKQPEAVLKEVRDLNDFLPAFKEAVEQTSPERHWVYRQMMDGAVCPAYVSNVEYVQRRGRDYPAHVDVSLMFLQGGKLTETKLAFYRSDISRLLRDEDAVGGGFDTLGMSGSSEEEEEEEDGVDTNPKPKRTRSSGEKRSLASVVASKRVVFESEELFEDYKGTLPPYAKYQGKVGVVVQGEGLGIYMTEFSSYRDEIEYNVQVSSVDDEGTLVDLVLDDTNVEEIKTTRSSGYSLFFGEYDEDEEKAVPKFWKTARYQIPFHPYLLAFDLRRHRHVWVYADRITERARTADILDRLVLNKADKGFLGLLMNAAEMKLEDIVKGKSGGVFVLCEGIPGTGKTLTAELYAESMNKALYNVQCSQLGISPKDIEERLKKVLARAERWQAVLLLDEADVYVRSRGTDVNHNAIVGVMLRVIEYYNGLLFMTTNLPDIDDAVRSRATAHVRYARPGPALLPSVWRVLSKQFGVELTDKDIKHLAEEWPEAVGRDVKNILKLMRFSCADGKEKPTAETAKEVSRYLDINKGKE